jgi:hypothetical protein
MNIFWKRVSFFAIWFGVILLVIVICSENEDVPRATVSFQGFFTNESGVVEMLFVITNGHRRPIACLLSMGRRSQSADDLSFIRPGAVARFLVVPVSPEQRAVIVYWCTPCPWADKGTLSYQVPPHKILTGISNSVPWLRPCLPQPRTLRPGPTFYVIRSR